MDQTDSKGEKGAEAVINKGYKNNLIVGKRVYPISFGNI